MFIRFADEPEEDPKMEIFADMRIIRVGDD
jgi:hypothetical protein